MRGLYLRPMGKPLGRTPDNLLPMASVVFYFELHQPFRLRRYSVFDTDPFYFDNKANEEILRKVADKCYRPATAKLLDLVQRHDRRFRVTFSVSGTALQQLEQWAPDVLDTLRRLVDTGALESIRRIVATHGTA